MSEPRTIMDRLMCLLGKHDWYFHSNLLLTVGDKGRSVIPVLKCRKCGKLGG